MKLKESKMGLRTTKLVKHRQEVREGYEAGGTMQEIASLYDVSVGTVRNELINQGVVIRSRGRHKQAKVVNPTKPEFTVSELDSSHLNEVPVKETPSIPTEPLCAPEEHNVNIEHNNDVTDNLRVIFGEGE
jgi:hypothetical protein